MVELRLGVAASDQIADLFAAEKQNITRIRDAFKLILRNRIELPKPPCILHSQHLLVAFRRLDVAADGFHPFHAFLGRFSVQVEDSVGALNQQFECLSVFDFQLCCDQVEVEVAFGFRVTLVFEICDFLVF